MPPTYLRTRMQTAIVETARFARFMAAQAAVFTGGIKGGALPRHTTKGPLKEAAKGAPLPNTLSVHPFSYIPLGRVPYIL